MVSYVEDVAAVVGDGCNMAFACSPSGVLPAAARGSFYRFSGPVRTAQFRSLVLRARAAQAEH
eukprot:661878-Pyramimonas_sp.AAC.1